MRKALAAAAQSGESSGTAWIEDHIAGDDKEVERLRAADLAERKLANWLRIVANKAAAKKKGEGES